MTSSTQSLQGIRVLDLSRILAGPWATQLLGDLGAEIIKVEKPDVGDDTRSWGPPYAEGKNSDSGKTAAYNFCTNRNKRSITLDFTTEAGREIVCELIKASDILVENYAVGGLTKYGLDYETVKTLNPKLIYCSITGFGQTGPWAKKKGYDFLIQGLGGLMSITGKPDAEPGGGPMKVGVALADILTGMYASTSILAALRYRDRTGEGQHIDLSLLDVQVSVLANQAMNYFYGNTVPTRLGNAHPNVVPYRDFKTKDGFIIIAVGNDTQFTKLVKCLGSNELADKKFSTNAARVKHRAAIESLIEEITLQDTSSVWVDKLESLGVPCGPINDLDSVFTHEQIQDRGMTIKVDHKEFGSLNLVGNPIKLSKTPVRYDLPPPSLGEHTDEVLSSICGLTRGEVEELRDKKII